MSKPKAANLTPQMLISAYCQGVFPMTDTDGITRWYTADPRGILPLDRFHCPRTLRQIVRQERFRIQINRAFPEVIAACKDVERPESHGGWISDDIINAYTRLHEIGFAHSVEAYDDQGQLAGGLYGVAIGGAFFGESMFHRATNASKVCLVHLVGRLRERGYTLLDTQMVTNHMRQFGATEIPAAEYETRLQQALSLSCRFV